MHRPFPSHAHTIAAAVAWICFAQPALAANDAAFVAQSVPAQVAAGASVSVDMTLQNTGDTTWSATDGYFLGSDHPQDNMTWGTNRIAMGTGDSVPPGSSYVFHGTLVAPSVPGDYDFQWRMLQDSVEWFGQATPNTVIHVGATAPLTCDGTEKLCLTLQDMAAIVATGATVSGDVNGDGFMPADQGGIDWRFTPADGLCSGKMEVDVKGMLPQQSPSDPEQVSVFETCGEGADASQVIGLQRMMLGYHGDNIFRYYATTDFSQFGWQLGVWTDGFEATSWTAEQTHHFVASWTSDAAGGASLALAIDGQSWSAQGTLPFDPQSQLFTLGNRCAHYPAQQATARFTNLRLWALGSCASVVPPDGGADASTDAPLAPDDGASADAAWDGTGWTPTGGSGGADAMVDAAGPGIAGQGGRSGGASGSDGGCACGGSSSKTTGAWGIAALAFGGWLLRSKAQGMRSGPARPGR